MVIHFHVPVIIQIVISLRKPVHVVSIRGKKNPINNEKIELLSTANGKWNGSALEKILLRLECNFLASFTLEKKTGKKIAVQN